MPPWPTNSRISSCGKWRARSAGAGGAKLRPWGRVSSGRNETASKALGDPSYRETNACPSRPSVRGGTTPRGSHLPEGAYPYLRKCPRRLPSAPVFFAADGGEQVAQLILDLLRRGHRLGDFRAEQFLVT